MKYLVILTCCLFLFGCSNKKTELKIMDKNIKIASSEIQYEYKKQILVTYNNHVDEISMITINQHDYIVYIKNKFTSNETGGMIHNPDCTWCQIKNEFKLK